MINLFRRSSNSKGFTLIELLVVVSIIGLLASIVVVSLGGSRTKGRDAKRLADLTQLQTAMELCYNDLDCASPNANDYPADVPNAMLTCAALLAETNFSRYLTAMPLDPLGSPYTCLSNSQSYCLSADMEAVAGTGAGSFIKFSDTGKDTLETTVCASEDDF